MTIESSRERVNHACLKAHVASQYSQAFGVDAMAETAERSRLELEGAWAAYDKAVAERAVAAFVREHESTLESLYDFAIIEANNGQSDRYETAHARDAAHKVRAILALAQETPDES